jgi:hypothetical protein
VALRAAAAASCERQPSVEALAYPDGRPRFRPSLASLSSLCSLCVKQNARSIDTALSVHGWACTRGYIWRGDCAVRCAAFARRQHHQIWQRRPAIDTAHSVFCLFGTKTGSETVTVSDNLGVGHAVQRVKCSVRTGYNHHGFPIAVTSIRPRRARIKNSDKSNRGLNPRIDLVGPHAVHGVRWAIAAPNNGDVSCQCTRMLRINSRQQQLNDQRIDTGPATQEGRTGACHCNATRPDRPGRGGYREWIIMDA